MNFVNLTTQTVMPNENDFSMQITNRYESLAGAEYDEGRTDLRHYKNYYRKPFDRDKYAEAAIKRTDTAFNKIFG